MKCLKAKYYEFEKAFISLARIITEMKQLLLTELMIEPFLLLVLYLPEDGCIDLRLKKVYFRQQFTKPSVILSDK